MDCYGLYYSRSVSKSLLFETAGQQRNEGRGWNEWNVLLGCGTKGKAILERGNELCQQEI